MGLSIAAALRLVPAAGGLKPAVGVIAFVGAGGKTTAMFQLARQLPSPVVVTTTTHVGTWQAALADQHVIATESDDIRALKLKGVTLVTGAATPDERFGALSSEGLARLRQLAQEQDAWLLIEADGARGKPLKAPAEHEPVIPPFVDLVVVVAGLTGLGKPLADEVVQRAGLFAALSGLEPGAPVTERALSAVLQSEYGGRRGIPPDARRVVLLNQADTDEQQAKARSMAADLLTGFESVIVADLQRSEIYAVQENVAGIVLAAGGSTRLGRPKVLLDWKGQYFVQAVARTALAAGLRPVVVVVGSDAEAVAAALQGSPVELVHNRDWEAGQASSIGAGLRALPADAGAAVFLLADQPQVHFDVVAALVDAHAASLAPIIAPLVREERRANPVLFDRATFAGLLGLQGDVGGRAIFSRHRVEYLPWHDDRLLLDVDTEADYRRLLEDDTL